MSNQNFSKFLNKGISTPKGILIIVLVAIIAGGIMAWQSGWLSEKEVKMTEREEEVKIPEEIIEDETADWKIYQNEEYGFKMAYSKNWMQREDIYPEAYLFRKDFTKIDKSDGKIAWYEGEKWPEYTISIIIQEKSQENISLENIAQKADGIKIIPSTNLGVPGIRYKIIAIPSTTNEIVEMVIRENCIYSIHFCGAGTSRTDQENIEVFNQMLSTFRFLE